MPVHVFDLQNPFAQSGKTTIALGALDRFAAQGVRVCIVMPTAEMAQDMRRRTTHPVLWTGAVLHESPETLRNARVVLIDCYDRVPLSRAPYLMTAVRNALSAHTGPTQIILT